MSRIVRCAIIQASNAKHDGTPAEIKAAMIEKHIPLIEDAGAKGAQILCLQEIFYGPYFVPNRISNGTQLPRKSRDRPSNGWLSTPKNTAW
jgi:beta-ureidopropionase